MSVEKLIGNESKSLCILVGGKAGTGKDVVKDFILNSVGGEVMCLETRFSNTIKHIARVYMDWNTRKDERGRKLLQHLGNVGREYDKDIWVRKTMLAIENSLHYPYDVVVIPDWRFPNEAKYIEEREPLYRVIKVLVVAENRESLKGTLEYADVTEVSLPLSESYYDFVIDNSGTLDETREQVSAINNYIWKYVNNK